ncbi:MAG TPA: hypothetical protein PKX32_04180, partial [Candidatus Saccharicenans sp.]|nr:hypothetical protein [Candidatus Saccharicenans sp.]
MYYRWRDRFWEARQKGLSNGGSEDEAKVLRAQVEKIEKIIRRQTIAIEALKKNSRVNLGEVVELMREKGMSLKSVCEALRISRSWQYWKESQRPGSIGMRFLVGRLKELRLLHPFWGY